MCNNDKKYYLQLADKLRVIVTLTGYGIRRNYYGLLKMSLNLKNLLKFQFLSLLKVVRDFFLQKGVICLFLPGFFVFLISASLYEEHDQNNVS